MTLQTMLARGDHKMHWPVNSDVHIVGIIINDHGAYMYKVSCDCIFTPSVAIAAITACP